MTDLTERLWARLKQELPVLLPIIEADRKRAELRARLDEHLRACPLCSEVGSAVDCEVCGQRKAPVGRSVPMVMCLCDSDCPGYRQPPVVGSLWPGETRAEFGYPNCERRDEIERELAALEVKGENG